MTEIPLPLRVDTDCFDLNALPRLDTVSELSVRSVEVESNTKRAAREVFVWLRQIARDADLSPLALRLAIEVSQHVDRKKGYAHPSHATLAADLAASRRGVQNALSQLQDRGHLDVRVSRGAGQANRYRLRIRRMARAAT